MNVNRLAQGLFFSLLLLAGLLLQACSATRPPATTDKRDTASLHRIDLIIEADGSEVKSVKAFEEILGKMPSGKVLRLLIQRKATLLYTTVTLE